MDTNYSLNTENNNEVVVLDAIGGMDDLYGWDSNLLDYDSSLIQNNSTSTEGIHLYVLLYTNLTCYAPRP